MFHLNDALTQEKRKLGHFQQTLLMTIILQIFVISVLCNTEDPASFDELHFLKITCLTFTSMTCTTLSL